MLQGVLIDEAIEVLFQLTRDFGRSTRARSIHQALYPLVGKAVDPFAQGGVGKGQRLGDSLETLPFDDIAYGLSTAEDTRLFGLFHEGIEGRQGVIGKVQCEGPHGRALSYKGLQKYQNMSHNIMGLPSSRNKIFSTQISQELLKVER